MMAPYVLTIALLLLTPKLFSQSMSHFGMDTDGSTTRLSAHIVISGKVVLDDGSAPPKDVLIRSECPGGVRNEGFTDKGGNFQITIDSASPSNGNFGLPRVYESGAGLSSGDW